MFRIVSLFVFIAVLLVFPLTSGSFAAQPGENATVDFKVNGASFAECVSMADALTEKGDELSAGEKYEKAIEYYNMAISINGSHIKALLNRGIAYYNSGLNDRALTDINRSIEIDDQLAKAFYFQGVIYSEAKEYEKAIESFNKSIALDPEQALALNARGIALVKKGFFVRAIDDYNDALSKDSSLTQSLNNRGNAYEQMGNYRRACRDWKRACESEFCDKFKFMEFIGACKNG